MATGVPSAGKTTHLKKLMAAGGDFVLVDHDDIRERLPFFQQALKEKRDSGASDREAERYAYSKHIRAMQYVSRTILNRLLEEGYSVAHSVLPNRLGTESRFGMSEKHPSFVARALQLDHKVELWIFDASDSTLKRSFDKRSRETKRFASADDLTPFDHDLGKAYDDLQKSPVEAKIFWRGSVNANALEVASFSKGGACHEHDAKLSKKIMDLRGINFSRVQNERFNAWSTRIGHRSVYSFDDQNPLTLN